MLDLIFSGSLYYALVITGKHSRYECCFVGLPSTKCLIQSRWYLFGTQSYKVRPFFSDRCCFFLSWEGEKSISAIYQYIPFFLSTEVHPSATHQYVLMDFKWVFIICEEVSLDIEQWWHFCIFKGTYLSNHVTQV